MDVEQVIEIAAPPGTVWTVMAGVERWPEWTPTTTSIELLDPGPLAVGSRARIRQPRLPVAVWTVTVLESERYFEWEISSPGLKSVAGHRVEPIDGGTQVTLFLAWSGRLAPLVRLFYGRLSHRYVQTEAEHLKRRAEATVRWGYASASDH
jgi:uncharacterized membrane protein